MSYYRLLYNIRIISTYIVLYVYNNYNECYYIYVLKRIICKRQLFIHYSKEWYDNILLLLDAPKPQATDPPSNIQLSFSTLTESKDLFLKPLLFIFIVLRFWFGLDLQPEIGWGEYLRFSFKSLNIFSAISLFSNASLSHLSTYFFFSLEILIIKLTVIYL